jgi:hypothetical protein
VGIAKKRDEARIGVFRACFSSSMLVIDAAITIVQILPWNG